MAFDGDADRCLLVDETGGVIDGDKVIAACGLALKEAGELVGGAIVGTVMSNLGLHRFCKEHGIGLFCTSVGDRNVLEKMLECGYASAASSRATRFSGATPPPETASSPRCNSWICSAAPAESLRW